MSPSVAARSVDEAMSMSGQDLAAPLGALPPVKIHCAQLVEGALRSALSGDSKAVSESKPDVTSPTLADSFAPRGGKSKIVLET